MHYPIPRYYSKKCTRNTAYSVFLLPGNEEARNHGKDERPENNIGKNRQRGILGLDAIIAGEF